MPEKAPYNQSIEAQQTQENTKKLFLAQQQKKRLAQQQETAGQCINPDQESIRIIKPGCALRIESKINRAKFIESIKSTSAFEEMAQYVKQFIKDRKFKAVYPASGSHSAPIVLAAKLIEDKSIDSAEMVFTEIDKTKLGWLIQNLKYLSATNPLFQISEPIKKDDKETHIPLTYKGKPILIKFTIGKGTQFQWFEDKDYSESTIVIGHDTNPGGNEKVRSSGIILQYIEAARKNKKNIPILCEDTRPSKLNSKRQFDPEFFGKIVATGEKAYGCGGEENIETGEEVKGFISHIKAIQKVETGKANTPSIILTLHKEVIDMDPFALKVLADISVGGRKLLKSLESIKRANIDEEDSTMHASANEKTQLFNTFKNNNYEHLSNIYVYSKYLLESFKKFDKKLTQRLAIRMLQNITKCYDQIPKFIATFNAKNMDKGISEFIKKIEMIESYLEGNEFTDIKKDINLLKEDILYIGYSETGESRKRENAMFGMLLKMEAMADKLISSPK